MLEASSQDGHVATAGKFAVQPLLQMLIWGSNTISIPFWRSPCWVYHTVHLTRFTCRVDIQIRTLCLSPDGVLLLSIDEEGRALLINRTRKVLLHHFSFKAPVAAATFSPDGKYIAVAVGKLLQVGLTHCKPAGFPVIAVVLQLCNLDQKLLTPVVAHASFHDVHLSAFRQQLFVCLGSVVHSFRNCEHTSKYSRHQTQSCMAWCAGMAHSKLCQADGSHAAAQNLWWLP